MVYHTSELYFFPDLLFHVPPAFFEELCGIGLRMEVYNDVQRTHEGAKRERRENKTQECQPGDFHQIRTDPGGS